MSKLQKDLDALQKAVQGLRRGGKERAEPKAASEAQSKAHHDVDFVERHIDEITAVVSKLKEHAAEVADDHPVATIASAMALGFAIGRLTAK